MIEAIDGYPGYGKSYFGVYEGRKWLKRGRPVYANFKMAGATTFRLTSNSFELWDEEKEIWKPAVLHFPRSTLVLLDEAQVFFNSRKWSDFGEQFMEFFSQTRKDGLRLIWMAQSVSSVDKFIRDRTHMMYKPTPWFGALLGHPILFTVKQYYGCKGKYKRQKDPDFVFMKWVFWDWKVARSYDTSEKFTLKKAV